MAEVLWTPIALKDLRSIRDYIARDSIFYADKFVEKLIARVDILENYPNSGKIVLEFNNKNIRELKEGDYRIIYRVETSGAIGIVRVRHSAQLLKSL